jgi:hypothetical protein
MLPKGLIFKNKNIEGPGFLALFISPAVLFS